MFYTPHRMFIYPYRDHIPPIHAALRKLLNLDHVDFKISSRDLYPNIITIEQYFVPTHLSVGFFIMIL